ncbi:hypothetical protein LXL04_011348 [Taraxacum kok-saghyz]
MVSIVVPVRSSVRLTSPRMQTKKESKEFRWAMILATFLQGGVKNAPGALCVLQEAMCVSYVEIPRDTMALSPPDYIKGCELLERELKLLQVRLLSKTPDTEGLQGFRNILWSVGGVGEATITTGFVTGEGGRRAWGLRFQREREFGCG